MLMKDFDTLGAIIGRGNMKRGLGLQVEAAMVLEYCKELLVKEWPEEIAQQIRPVSVSNKILKLASKNSQLLAEMRFKETDLIEAINLKFGVEHINKIQFILI
ncbi:MAG: hypothetical protein AUJ28_03750 [Parcubacteria group bacterium CG1_02_37_51]|uniref:DUF721 domain-containing protein n=2 Tax=Candidatus Komeiliibacteriota TaxID=1817908 RepID=A0A2M8DR71_9BACT|nr:MAG: hypothetical protein AUJ28_03750 [Parcubacteria group bacterium CG1_02_37_51]PIY95300.1 MAG: hypothetical protein COY67_00650 [Candidatus Komeilibacteria bacterium CG_4_10_14_0_8_um_filter_37_78]PJC01889.1 MAG: hypothetical protein CO073_02355 [Candidatus Komeilibacteria bacterium CG_4_9_14_0_8_um_filter_36_9]